MAQLSALFLLSVAVLAAPAAVAATPGFEEDFATCVGGFGSLGPSPT